MKLQLALASALLAVSSSAVQATDARTPDILGSISAESVQILNKSESSKVRGSYFITYGGYYNFNGSHVGFPQVYFYGPTTDTLNCNVGGLSCVRYPVGSVNGHTYYISR